MSRRNVAASVVQPTGALRTLWCVDPQGETDAQLWLRAAAGDGTTFGVLFDRHRDRVYRHVCRLVNSRQDAEDAVAVTFLELWRRRREVRLVNGSVLAWLLVTATNTGHNTSRAARRYRALLARLPREQSAAGPADIVEAGLLGVDPMLRTALRTLPRTDLQLFTLVALEGYPLAEAASILGLTPSAVKSRLHRIRQRMREQLDNYPPDHLTCLGVQP